MRKRSLRGNTPSRSAFRRSTRHPGHLGRYALPFFASSGSPSGVVPSPLPPPISLREIQSNPDQLPPAAAGDVGSAARWNGRRRRRRRRQSARRHGDGSGAEGSARRCAWVVAAACGARPFTPDCGSAEPRLLPVYMVRVCRPLRRLIEEKRKQMACNVRGCVGQCCGAHPRGSHSMAAAAPAPCASWKHGEPSTVECLCVLSSDCAHGDARAAGVGVGAPPDSSTDPKHEE